MSWLVGDRETVEKWDAETGQVTGMEGRGGSAIRANAKKRKLNHFCRVLREEPSGRGHPKCKEPKFLCG